MDWKKFKVLAAKIGKDDVYTQAAALAYFTTLAVAPLIILMLSFLSFLNIDLREQLKIETTNLMGEEASQILQSIMVSAAKRPDLSITAGWVAAVLLAISGSVVFAQLHSALNIIFKVPLVSTESESILDFFKGLISRRLLSLGLFMAFIFISIVSLMVSATVSYLMIDIKVFGIMIISGMANLMVYSVLFALIYKKMTDRYVALTKCFFAGILTAALFVAGKSLIGSYVGHAAMSSAYGAAGSLVVFLVWIYYSALVFFLGAEVSSVFLIENEKDLNETV